MSRIKRISIFLRYAFWVALVAIPIIETACWVLFNGDINSYFISECLQGLDPEYLGPLTVPQKFLGLLVSCPYVALRMFCCWQLAKLFKLYSDGHIFTSENSACYSKAAWALLIGEVLYPVIQTAISYIATMNNPVGKRLIMIGFDDTNASNIVIACVILAISWVMDEGRKLQDEAKLII
ncbi:DUF2975 domain-containing protein [Maridesulfovibrio sp.]|uniref:DUF2975 domain-containing protein n=1 Tax=Maridesulfovibrio sp. TaxID=2795000 RepID=UPI0039F11C80